MIAVVDYGMGNLRSVEKGIARTGADVCVTSNVETIRAADGVVLPGVGAFGACMDNLRAHRLVDVVRDVAVADDRPFLGICLGLQLLFDESEEFGPVRGLGVLPGRVRRFDRRRVGGGKIPHMGWNRLRIQKPVEELEGLTDGCWVYFVHSYYVEPALDSIVCGTTDYGPEFCSAVSRGNLFATQFHPEKSQAVGLQILGNFARKVRNFS